MAKQKYTHVAQMFVVATGKIVEVRLRETKTLWVANVEEVNDWAGEEQFSKSNVYSRGWESGFTLNYSSIVSMETGKVISQSDVPAEAVAQWNKFVVNRSEWKKQRDEEIRHTVTARVTPLDYHHEAQKVRTRDPKGLWDIDAMGTSSVRELPDTAPQREEKKEVNPIKLLVGGMIALLVMFGFIV